MGFRGLWIDLYGFERRCIGLGKRLRRRLEAVPGESAVAIGQSRVRGAVAWVLVDRLLEVDQRLLQAVGAAFVPVVAALEICLVRPGIDLRPAWQTRLLSRSQFNVDLVSDRSRHGILQRQYV